MKKQGIYAGLFLLLAGFLTNCNKQQTTENAVQNTPAGFAKTSLIAGGGCDGCELMYAGIPAIINPVDTSPGWREAGQKLLISGTVYQIDGKTPANNVILYYWQTDNNGYYSPKAGMNENAKKHGHIRGWVKTAQNGNYRIYTIRPAPYPNDNLPAHIHMAVKEPNINNEYYIDDITFEDDTLLAPYTLKHPVENRGGSGVVKPALQNGVQIATRNIICGFHIPNYPAGAGQ
ncbi:intradiol ring-cleavage dioxygenase [Sphingobacteriales bacterium UPWRP_1]|nr:intradiol ring-cleavage dioxygenase [Sphingobacteriales bacterium UPWRP_1]